LFRAEVLLTMAFSTLVVAAGLWLGWKLYGSWPSRDAAGLDPLERLHPGPFGVLRDKFYVDELYGLSVLRLNAWLAWVSDWFDRAIWSGVVRSVGYLVLGVSWLSRLIDEYVVNLGFDEGCARLREGGGMLSRLQSGRIQGYLRVLGVAMAALVMLLAWGCRS
jgi:NADH-quinone oxidoreductase subunit L